MSVRNRTGSVDPPGRLLPKLVKTIGSVLPSHHSAERRNCPGSHVVIVSKSVNNGRVRLARNPRTHDLGTVHELKNFWGSTPPNGPGDQGSDGDEYDGQEPLIKELLHENNQPLRGRRRSGASRRETKSEHFDLIRLKSGDNQIKSNIFRFLIYLVDQRVMARGGQVWGTTPTARSGDGPNRCGESGLVEVFLLQSGDEVRSMIGRNLARTPVIEQVGD